MKKKGQIVHGGGLYGQRIAGGPLEPVPGDHQGAVDAWICRRLADYPHEQMPVGGALDTCSVCSAVIVFSPHRTVVAPKRCMQCSGIEPLPFDR